VTIEVCDPPQAEWYAEVIFGRPGETDYNYQYFRGGRPGDHELTLMVPGGRTLLESKIKRCPNPGDESQCRWCSDDIEFAVDGDTRWGRTDGEDAATHCGANPEDDRHEPVDDYNE
jgi:hypothetical protein